MSETTTFERDDADSADLKKAVEECIRKIDSIRSQMDGDQKEIDALKSETKEILERLKAA